jgi:hypothetical protein
MGNGVFFRSFQYARKVDALHPCRHGDIGQAQQGGHDIGGVQQGGRCFAGSAKNCRVVQQEGHADAFGVGLLLVPGAVGT